MNAHFLLLLFFSFPIFTLADPVPGYGHHNHISKNCLTSADVTDLTNKWLSFFTNFNKTDHAHLLADDFLYYSDSTSFFINFDATPGVPLTKRAFTTTESLSPFSNNGLAHYKIVHSAQTCDYFIFVAQLSGGNVPLDSIATEIDWLYARKDEKSGKWVFVKAYVEFNSALLLFKGGDVCFPPGKCVGGPVLPGAPPPGR